MTKESVQGSKEGVWLQGVLASYLLGTHRAERRKEL